MRSVVSLTRNLWSWRHLLLQMTWRDIKSRFAGSFGGILWSLVHPLLMFVVYLLVFVHIFRMRAPEYAGESGFALYLMAGLFPWLAFAEGMQRSTSSLIENASLVQRTVFPVEVLPAKSVLASFLTNGIALVILAVYVLATRANLAILLLLPVLAVLQLVMTLGVGFLLASLSPFLRDIVQVVQVAVSFWIFLTPILYPVSLIPEWGRWLMWLNPFFPIVDLFHDAFILGRLQDPASILAACCWSAGFFLAGSFVFAKLRYEFADWL